MWGVFAETAQERGWGRWKVKLAWRKMVYRLYEDAATRHAGHFFVTKDVHGKPVPQRLNPWALYDAHFKNLPDDEQWDTPRSSRKPKGSPVSFRVLKRYREKELRADVKFFEHKIKETGDPTGEYKWRLAGTKYQLKTGEY